MPSTVDPASFANAALVESMYRQWKTDQESVGADWRLFFQGFELGFARPATTGSGSDGPAHTNNLGGPPSRVNGLVYAYRDIGHTIAKLDPIGINNRESNPHLALEQYGLSDADLFGMEDDLGGDGAGAATGGTPTDVDGTLPKEPKPTGPKKLEANLGRSQGLMAETSMP